MKILSKYFSKVDNERQLSEMLGNLLVGIFRHSYLWILALSLIFVLAAGPLLGILVLGACLLRHDPKDEEKIQPRERVPIHELAASLSLCLTPFSLYVIAKLFTGAMTPRYALITITGFAILSGFICQYIFERSKIWAATILLCFIASLLFTLGNDLVLPYRRPKLPFNERIISFIQKSSTPIIISGSKLYLKMYHYLPDNIKSKPQYLIDRELMRHYLGYDTDQIDLVNLNAIVSLNLSPYKDFIHSSKVFMVVGKKGWLIKKIIDDVNKGLAQLEVL